MVARRSLVLAVVGAALAAYVPAVAFGDVSSEATLADRYAPVVRLVAQQEPCGGGEPYLPTDVDVVLGNDQVALRGPWEGSNLVKVAPTAADLAAGLPNYHLDFPGDALQPGCTYEDWQREFGASATPTDVCPHPVRVGPDGASVLVLLHLQRLQQQARGRLGDDPARLRRARRDGRAGRLPTDVGYSQHDGAETAAWDASKLEKVGGTHPVVYPAEGSHANYYGPALYLGSSADRGRGLRQHPRPVAGAATGREARAGRSGAMVAEYPWLGSRPLGREHAAFYNGPTGPNAHSQWDHPITWAATRWHPAAFAVPEASRACRARRTSSAPAWPQARLS